jgi:hypothetical protein
MPGLVLVGFGAGLSFVAITTAALARVDEAAAGLAAGVLSTSVQIGLSLGLAALVAISSARTTELAASGATPVAAEVGGIQLGFLVAAATAFAGSVTALVTLRGDRPGASASDEYRLDKRPPAREPKKEMKSHPSPEMAWKTPQRAGFVIQRTPARESRPSRGSRLPPRTERGRRKDRGVPGSTASLAIYVASAHCGRSSGTLQTPASPRTSERLDRSRAHARSGRSASAPIDRAHAPA